MDELELLTRLRADIPAGIGTEQARRALDDVMRQESRHRSGRRSPSRRTRMTLIAVTAGVAAVVVAIAIVPTGGSDHERSIQQSRPLRPTQSLGRPLTAVQLVDFARRTASRASFNPRPHQWIYFKRESAASSSGEGGALFGPPNERRTTQNWMEVNHNRYAERRHGHLVVGPNHVLGTPYGLHSDRYSYLNSLPNQAPALRRAIAHEMRLSRHVGGDMFDAINAIMENIVLPPRLQPELYAILAGLPHVQYRAAATDIAGRNGVAFTEVQQGRLKAEIVIDPHTYTYLGDKYVAVRDYTVNATDGTRHFHKGQVLGWNAILAEGIVDHPGDTQPASPN